MLCSYELSASAEVLEMRKEMRERAESYLNHFSSSSRVVVPALKRVYDIRNETGRKDIVGSLLYVEHDSAVRFNEMLREIKPVSAIRAWRLQTFAGYRLGRSAV